jgi:hypothetical protein
LFSAISFCADGAAGMSVPPLAAGASEPWRASLFLRLGFFGLCRCRSTGLALGDMRQQRVDLDRLAVLGEDLAQRAGDRRGHFDRDLVGFQFDQRLVDLDGVARLLEPGADGGFADGFAKGRDADFSSHDVCFRSFSVRQTRELDSVDVAGGRQPPSASSRKASSCAR